MKITDIKVEEFQWKRSVPISNGKHTYATAELGIVTIMTDEGIKGIGYGAIKFVEHFRDLLIGEDPLCVEKLWHKMWVPKLVGRRGISTRAISAIDVALWDIKAKAAKMPLYQLLGGAKELIPVYIAGGYYEAGKDLGALAYEMQEYVSWGVKAVKMKIGALDQIQDAARVEAVRKAIGPEIQLMVDANCAYQTFEAITFAKRIEQYEPYWFEEPVEPDNYEGMSKIVQSTSIPIASGENEYTRYGFRDLIGHGNVPILNADAFVLGGITEFMKVSALAQAHYCKIAPHGSQTIHVHLVCAIINSLILEYYPKRFDDVGDSIYTYSLELNKDGTVSPPNVPGHGFEPNYEVLERFKIS